MWADCVLEDWADCVWEDWTDCVWDKFAIAYQDPKTRTMRMLSPEGAGSFRRPYLEGNPSYTEDSRKSPDVAVENARIKVKDETRPHMTMKQPYRYEQFQKMKYQDEPLNDRLAETSGDIMAEEVPEEYEWRWVRYLDNKRWTPTTGGWFDNRWLEDPDVETWVQHLDDNDWYDYYYSLGGNPEQIIWDGTKWVIQQWNGTALQELGTWVESYRPTHIKINYGGALEWKLIDSADDDIVTQDSYTSGQAVEITWGSNAIKRIKFYFDANDTITNIRFGTITTGGLDLSVVAGSWWKDLRPRKFRMKFDNATANVSLRDKNGTEIYANATYASGDEVYLTYSGADIDRLVVSGCGDITDIEVSEQVEEGLYLGSDQRRPRKELKEGEGRMRFPNPNLIQSSERLPRRTNLRPTR